MKKSIIGVLIVLVLSLSVFAMSNQTPLVDGSGRSMSIGKSITYYLAPGAQVINQKIYYAPGAMLNRYAHKKMFRSGKQSRYGQCSKYNRCSGRHKIFYFGKKLVLLGLALALVIFVWKRVTKKKNSKKSKRRK